MELVSIVVTVYNVEKYLNRCIDSILNQTYKNIEVILVDDGSKDSSGKICDKYAIKDKRIIVYHTENQGVSIARNLGIENSNGEFITFIDSDDMVSDDYISYLYDMCTVNNVDLAILGSYSVNGENIISLNDDIKAKFSRVCAINNMLDERYFSSTVWGKIYRKELFNDIRFSKNLKIAEDLDVNIKIFNKVKSIYVDTRKKAYYYTLNRKGAATNNKYNRDWENEVNLCESIIENFRNDSNILPYAIKRYVRVNYSLINKILKNVPIDIKNYNILKR